MKTFLFFALIFHSVILLAKKVNVIIDANNCINLLKVNSLTFHLFKRYNYAVVVWPKCRNFWPQKDTIENTRVYNYNKQKKHDFKRIGQVLPSINEDCRFFIVTLVNLFKIGLDCGETRHFYKAGIAKLYTYCICLTDKNLTTAATSAQKRPAPFCFNFL